MKLSAKLDMKKTSRLLKSAAVKYGDNQEQAVARLAVATGRELAVRTQAFGANSRKQQEGAILRGMQSAVRAVTAKEFKAIMKRGGDEAARCVATPNELSEKLDAMRDEKGWVQRQIGDFKLVATTQTFNACYKERKKRAGKAKGAWLGAAEKAAGKQKGNDRISIGKNFMAYAQKFKARGKVNFSGGFLAAKSAYLTNTFFHAKFDRVLPASQKRQAIDDAKVKALKWYRKANKANALKNK